MNLKKKNSSMSPEGVHNYMHNYMFHRWLLCAILYNYNVWLFTAICLLNDNNGVCECELICTMFFDTWNRFHVAEWTSLYRWWGLKYHSNEWKSCILHRRGPCCPYRRYCCAHSVMMLQVMMNHTYTHMGCSNGWV